jgi:hypothetical protein
VSNVHLPPPSFLLIAGLVANLKRVTPATQCLLLLDLVLESWSLNDASFLDALEYLLSPLTRGVHNGLLTHSELRLLNRASGTVLENAARVLEQCAPFTSLTQS